METKLFTGESPINQDRADGIPFDFKRVLFRALRFWYVIVISLTLALLYGYLTNRYAIRIYPVSASIIIKEAQETGGAGAELLYNNVLINQYRNYLNEPYIIRSFPLIQKVVEDLNYDVSFYREGRLQTQDAYDYVPITAVPVRNGMSHPTSGVITIISATQFRLSESEEEANGRSDVYNFGDSVNYNGNIIRFFKKNKNNDKEYMNVPFLMTISDAHSVAGQYIGRLGVSWAEQGSGVIDLSLNGANVEREINFLSGLIRKYQQNDLDQKNQTATRTIEFISREIDLLSDSMKRVEAQLQDFKELKQNTDLSDKAERLLERLELVEKERTEFIIREEYYKYVNSYINNSNSLDQIILPSAMGISDPVVNDVLTKLEKVQFDIKLGREMGKDSNPLLRDKELRSLELKKDIQEAISTLRNTDKIKLDWINGQVKMLSAQLDQLPLTQRQYISVRRNYSLIENLYIFLMQKLSEAKISKASNTPDIITVNPPMQAGGAITPKVNQNYIVAVMIGLLVPFLFFGAAELLNNRIQSKEDIEKLTTIPFVGGIGHNSIGRNLVVEQKPKSSIAESFRSLRSNLNYFTSNEDKKIFLISSSISGEGKTFTTLNLATVIAMSGKRTLIVGADMRKPKLYDDLGLNNDTGLSTFLSSMASLDNIIQQTSVENMFLISAGPVPPNPSELLMTARMSELMKELKSKFDYIILDTPPIALVTDAFVLSQYADHSIFLVRQNYTPKSMLRNVEESYRMGRLKNISLLLNDIYRTGPGYGYGYNYGYGYGYGYRYGYGYGTRKKNDSYYDEGDRT